MRTYLLPFRFIELMSKQCCVAAVLWLCLVHVPTLSLFPRNFPNFRYSANWEFINENTSWGLVEHCKMLGR